MGELADGLAEADYVVLAAPLTDATRRHGRRGRARRMRPTARLINVGRGPLVVQDDLVEALAAGRIAGAALDVFADEPLPESSPLWEMPNVIVSPAHVRGRGRLAVGTGRAVRRQPARYLDGRPLRNVVDKRRGYVGTT